MTGVQTCALPISRTHNPSPETLAAATYASCSGVFQRASPARIPDPSSPASALPSPPAKSASRVPGTHPEPGSSSTPSLISSLLPPPPRPAAARPAPDRPLLLPRCVPQRFPSRPADAVPLPQSPPRVDAPKPSPPTAPSSCRATSTRLRLPARASRRRAMGAADIRGRSPRSEERRVGKECSW